MTSEPRTREFDGLAAIVTGGASGIGEATADEGADVAGALNGPVVPVEDDGRPGGTERASRTH